MKFSIAAVDLKKGVNILGSIRAVLAYAVDATKVQGVDRPSELKAEIVVRSRVELISQGD